MKAEWCIDCNNPATECVCIPQDTEITEPKTIPVVIYKSGERIVIGEAEVQGDDIRARIFDSEAVPQIAKAMNQGVNLFSFGDPNGGDARRSSDIVLDRRDWAPAEGHEQTSGGDPTA